MDYNGVGPWNDAVVSLKIQHSRMLGSVLFVLGVVGDVVAPIPLVITARLALFLVASVYHCP